MLDTLERKSVTYTGTFGVETREMYVVPLADLLKVAEVASQDGWDSDGVKVRTGYSGRGMYGQTCVGFTLNGVSESVLGMALAEVLGSATAKALASAASTDSMGRGIIVYYRGVTTDAVLCGYDCGEVAPAGKTTCAACEREYESEDDE